MQHEMPLNEAFSEWFPRPVGIVVSKDREGKINPTTVSWMTQVSVEPPMLAVAVSKTRYSAQTIPTSECFTVAIPTVSMRDQAVLFGKESGREVNKIGLCVCPVEKAIQIDSVLLLDALANYECELESYLPAGDHIVFVGRVVAYHRHADPERRLGITGAEDCDLDFSSQV